MRKSRCWLVRTAIASLVLLIFASEPVEGRNPNAKPPVIGVSLTRNRNPLAKLLKASIPQLSSVSVQEVERRIGLFKAQIERSIRIIRKENPQCGPQIATCLDKLLKADAICIGLRMPQAASTGWDKCAACKVSEGINLNKAFLFSSPTILQGQPAPLHDLITYQLVTNLLHEGGHLKDDGKPSPGSADAFAEVQAKVGAAEEKAHQQQLVTVTEAKQLLEAIVNSKSVPAPKRELNKELLRELNQLPASERQARARVMLTFFCNRGIPGLQQQVLRWQIHKNRWNQKLQNAINQQNLRKRQKQSRLFIRPDNLLHEEGKHAYVGGGGEFDFGDGRVEEGSTGIWQAAGDLAGMLEVSEVDHIYDCWVADGGATLLVVGGLLDTEDGVVIGYADVDGDGLFEPETRVEAIRSNELYGGASLVWDEAAGQLVAFNRETNGIWALGYTGSAEHEFPDQLECRGFIGFDRDDILYIALAEDGLTAYGYGEEWELPPDPDTMIPMATASVVGGEFSPAGMVSTYASAGVAPVFLKLPVAGDTTLLAAGRAGSEVLAIAVEGETELLIGQGVLDALGEGTLALTRPLEGGELVRVDDPGLDESSVVEVVQSPRPLGVGGLFRSPEGSFVLFEGTPGTGFDMGSGADLTFPDSRPAEVDGYGSTWVELPVDPGAARFFVRGSP